MTTHDDEEEDADGGGGGGDYDEVLLYALTSLKAAR